MENEEQLPVVDNSGNIIGSAPRSFCHDGQSMTLHPVVHLHVVDQSGRLLMQKRSKSKRIQPGKWDTAVGGHITFGETPTEALRREAAEEIGLDIGLGGITIQTLGQYVFRSAVEQELICANVCILERDFSPSTAEKEQIDEFGWFTPAELELMIERGETTPNFADEYKTLVHPHLLMVGSQTTI